MAGTSHKGQVGEEDLAFWHPGDTETFTRETSSGGILTLRKFGSPGGATDHFKGVWYVSTSPSITDHGDATMAGSIAWCLEQARLAGGGRVVMPVTTSPWLASRLTIPRFVTLEGAGPGISELKQIAGSNKDFITSENFAALTGSGLKLDDDARVPTFFGLRKLRVCGNRTGGNTTGRAVAIYGIAFVLDELVIYNAAEANLYTEYSAGIGSNDWTGQEESTVDNLWLRDAGTDGWQNRGPHDMLIGTVTTCYNRGWGYKSEVSLPTYDGGVSRLVQMHSYSNGMASTPAADTGIWIGANTKADLLIIDGDGLKVSANATFIDRVRSVFGGDQSHAIEWSGSEGYIGDGYVEMHSGSVGQNAAVISGSGNRISIWAYDGGAGSDDNGVLISGDNNDVKVNIREFKGTGRYGVKNTGASNNIHGRVVLCSTCLDVSGATGFGHNIYGPLTLVPDNGQVGLTGTPAYSDRLDIQAYANSGAATGIGNSEGQYLSSALDLTSTAVQTATITHGLLFAPSSEQIQLSLYNASSATDFAVAWLAITAVSATQITAAVKLSTGSATGGAQFRLGVKVKLRPRI